MGIRRIDISGNGEIFKGMKRGTQSWLFKPSGDFIIDIYVDPSFSDNYELVHSIGADFYLFRPRVGGVMVKFVIRNFVTSGQFVISWEGL